MMISQTAEYALRAVVWLASHPDIAVSTPAIAEATRVPAGYLSKVLQELSRAGIVESQPGRNGGFRLIRSPEALSVLDVINTLDPIERIRQCPLGMESHAAQLCPLHRRLDGAIGLMQQAFAQSTIAELVLESGSSAPLCATRAQASDEAPAAE
jgi:Rrf2 family protein